MLTKELYKIKEVAEMLNITKAKVKLMIESGKLINVGDDKHIMITRNSLIGLFPELSEVVIDSEEIPDKPVRKEEDDSELADIRKQTELINARKKLLEAEQDYKLRETNNIGNNKNAVITVERTGEEIISEALEEAERIKADARNEAGRILSEERTKARVLAEEIITQAKEEADEYKAEKEEELEQYNEAIDARYEQLKSSEKWLDSRQEWFDKDANKYVSERLQKICSKCVHGCYEEYLGIGKDKPLTCLEIKERYIKRGGSIFK